MIDWITAVVPCQHSQGLIGGKLLNIDANGTIEWEADKQLTVEGSYSSKIQVRTLSENQIWISGNPAKFLQGHNLFGSNSPRKLIFRFLDTLTKPLTGILHLKPREYRKEIPTKRVTPVHHIFLAAQTQCTWRSKWGIKTGG